MSLAMSASGATLLPVEGGGGREAPPFTSEHKGSGAGLVLGYRTQEAAGRERPGSCSSTTGSSSPCPCHAVPWGLGLHVPRCDSVRNSFPASLRVTKGHPPETLLTEPCPAPRSEGVECTADLTFLWPHPGMSQFPWGTPSCLSLCRT